MSDKTGEPYESLTQVIFQSLLNQKEIPNLKVERNVTLQGKTARHQIDVYWKFEVGGVSHEVIVQAKDWQKPVDQLHLLAFSKILDDLPGQPRGIFVTRSGYQQGAEEFGLAHGILLYDLREIEYPPAFSISTGGWAHYAVVQMPMDGLVTTPDDSPIDPRSAIALGFKFEIFNPHFTDITFEGAASWIKAEYPHVKDDQLTKTSLTPELPLKRQFFDENGTEVGNLGSIAGKILEGMRTDQVTERQATHVFDPPVFIQTGDPLMPRIKVTAVSMSVEVTRTESVQRAKMSNFSQLVLHQLNSDKSWWFGATAQVLSTLTRKRKTKERKENT